MKNFKIIALLLILTVMAIKFVYNYTKLKKRLEIKEAENEMLKLVLADEGLIPKEFVKGK